MTRAYDDAGYREVRPGWWERRMPDGRTWQARDRALLDAPERAPEREGRDG